MVLTQDIGSLRKLLDTKEISALELAEHYINKIKDKDSLVESYITVSEERAFEDAKAAQVTIDKGEAKALTGIPLGIKDNICTKGVRTTCASKMLENFMSPYNATVINRLIAQDFVMLGKTNLDEFAMGGSCQTSYYKKTKNPYDLSKVPGGSSGGSAAAVSADLCVASLGSDTGGSIRQPASFCGVTGLKPSYGTVSRFGLVAFASSLDQIGPIANSAKDCAILFDAICGYDPNEGTSVKREYEASSSKLGTAVKGMKFALIKELIGTDVNDNVRNAVLNAVKVYEDMGAVVKEVSMPSLKYCIPAYYLIASAEASSNLSRYDGVKYGYRATGDFSYDELIKKTRAEGFGDEVKRRILLGTYALSSGYYDAYYKKAVSLRQLIKSEYQSILADFDAIITPTAPTTAYGLNENIGDPVKMYLSDVCTVATNIAGLPAISTTCGYDNNGLPIGMSITGRMFDEATIIAVADSFEQTFAKKCAEVK